MSIKDSGGTDSDAQKLRPVRLILGMPITTEENTGLLYSTRFSVTSAGPTAKTRNHKLPNELQF